jgi:hypothetical protein
MHEAIAGLVTRYDAGALSRRELIAALAALAGFASKAAAQTGGPAFKAEGINHLSYEVSHVARTRDFYVNVLGMRLDSRPRHSELVLRRHRTDRSSGSERYTRLASTSRVHHPGLGFGSRQSRIGTASAQARLDLGGLPRTGSFHVRIRG